MKLGAQIISIADVDARKRDAMFALMERYYTGMKRESFETDLNEKQWVIQLVDAETRALRGFSTQMVLEIQVGERPVRVLFSGDTIVDRDCWGQSFLARAWGRLALSLIDPRGSDLYWFLISKGYKTYRYLPLFFREFYPRFDRPTPAWAKQIVDVLGRRKFFASYDSSSGIVRAAPLSCRLRRGVAEIDTVRLRDPHIRFFNERNPGHERGDELCCLAPVTYENFTAAAARPLGEKHKLNASA